MKVLMEWSDGSRKVLYHGVELSINPRGVIGWASDWCEVFNLSQRGLLNTRHLGPATYGHVEYIVPSDKGGAA